MDFLFIKKCSALSNVHYREAAKNRKNTYIFLAHLRMICRPHECEEQVLAFFSEVAKVAQAFNRADKTNLRPEDYFWLDGHLQIKIQVIDMFSCRITMLSGKGGLYEVMKQCQLYASFFDFQISVKSHSLIFPLKIVRTTDNSILLEVDTEASQNKTGFFAADLHAREDDDESLEFPSYLIPTILPPDEDQLDEEALPHPPGNQPLPSDLLHAIINPSKTEAKPPQGNIPGAVLPKPKAVKPPPPREKKDPQRTRQKKAPPSKPPTDEELDKAWDVFSEVASTNNRGDAGTNQSGTFPDEEPPSALQHAILPPRKK